MRLYEYIRKIKSGSQFYRVKIGELSNLNHTDKTYSLGIDTWHMPMSPTRYIVIDSNPIICSNIQYCAEKSFQKDNQEEAILLDIILVKIVEHQTKN